MNCREFRNKIDLKMGNGSFEIEADLMGHMQACESCRLYSEEISVLRDGLIRQRFEVIPGELDDITFENIAALSGKRREATRGIIPSIGKWAWIPAAAAAIILIAVLIPNMIMTTDNGLTESEIYDPLDWAYEYDIIVSENLGSMVIASLVANETELDQLAEELLSESDFDELLESLTDEELGVLYERIDLINGSAG